MQQGGPPPILIPHETLTRLLELLEVAARRGAFELEEYLPIGKVFEEALAYLLKHEP